MEEKIARAVRRPEKQALAERMRREMTLSERRLWGRLRANRLDGLAFRRQQVIGGFIADFYCRAARLIIECDGNIHAAQVEYDQARDQILAAYNLRILRFTNERINHDLDTVLTEIVRAATLAPKSDALP